MESGVILPKVRPPPVPAGRGRVVLNESRLARQENTNESRAFTARRSRAGDVRDSCHACCWMVGRLSDERPRHGPRGCCDSARTSARVRRAAGRIVCRAKAPSPCCGVGPSPDESLFVRLSACPTLRAVGQSDAGGISQPSGSTPRVGADLGSCGLRQPAPCSLSALPAPFPRRAARHTLLARAGPHRLASSKTLMKYQVAHSEPALHLSTART